MAAKPDVKLYVPCDIYHAFPEQELMNGRIILLMITGLVLVRCVPQGIFDC